MLHLSSDQKGPEEDFEAVEGDGATELYSLGS